MNLPPLPYAQALSKQKSLTNAEWLARCDELAQQQPVLFFELLTFLRDGVPEKLGRRLVDYLSAMQFASQTLSPNLAVPVLLPEFQASIKRTLQFFHALSTDDPAHFGRMIKAWGEGLVDQNAKSVWAGCVETLNDPEITAHPLFKSMVCTLAAVADVYARRMIEG